MIMLVASEMFSFAFSACKIGSNVHNFGFSLIIDSCVICFILLVLVWGGKYLVVSLVVCLIHDTVVTAFLRKVYAKILLLKNNGKLHLVF